MRIKIHKNVPIPPKRSFKKERFPFKNMKKGDSFILRRYTKQKASDLQSSSGAFCRREKLKWQFTVRKVKEGVQIWRIK